MRIGIASDHAGIKMRKQVAEILQAQGHIVIDFGPQKSVPVDYPDFAQGVCHGIQSEDLDRGILICGTGVGMCIAANRFSGIRAAVGNEKSVCKAREHNDINIICFGARIQTIDEITACLDCFLHTESSTQPRHRKRIDKLDIIGGL